MKSATWLIERCERLPSGCLLWKCARTPNGYPKTTVRGRTVAVHRLAFEVFRGPIPAGLDVLHTCDVPHCIEASHLFLGTDVDNAADRAAKGRNGISLGESNGAAKLTVGAVEALRRRAAAGERHAALALAFGVSRQQVGRVVAGEQWRRVA